MKKPAFSIVTPTYNRDHLIERVYSSLMKQTFKDFEWVVIDDGSIDKTESIIKKYKLNCSFNIKYIKTVNQGKANALNESLKHCNGILYLVFDSDDWCDSNALSRLYSEFNKVKERSDFSNYCSLSCLKRSTAGEVIGDNYDSLIKYGLSYIDRANYNIKGDKWECLIFEKSKDIKYPVYKDDKYMAPGYVWLSLAAKGYKTVFLNEPLSTIEYQADGISKNNIYHRVNSSKTTYRYYFDISKIKGLNLNYLIRMKINKNRFLLHSKIDYSLFQLVNPTFVIGYILYLKDVFKIRK